MQSRSNGVRSRCNQFTSVSERSRLKKKEYIDKLSRRIRSSRNPAHARFSSFQSKRKTCVRPSQSSPLDSHNDDSCTTALSNETFENVCLSSPPLSSEKEEKEHSSIQGDSSETTRLMKSLLAYDEETIDVGLILLQLHSDIRVNTTCNSSPKVDSFQYTMSTSHACSDTVGENKSPSSSDFTSEAISDPTLESECEVSLESPESPVGLDRGFETPPQSLDFHSNAQSTIEECSTFDCNSITHTSDRECNENYLPHSDTMSGLSDISDTAFPSMDDILSDGHLSEDEKPGSIESPESPDAVERGTPLQQDDCQMNDLFFEPLSSTGDEALEFEFQENYSSDIESPQSPIGADRGPCMLEINSPDSSDDQLTEESDSSASPDRREEDDLPHRQLNSLPVVF